MAGYSPGSLLPPFVKLFLLNLSRVCGQSTFSCHLLGVLKSARRAEPGCHFWPRRAALCHRVAQGMGRVSSDILEAPSLPALPMSRGGSSGAGQLLCCLEAGTCQEKEDAQG